MGKSTIKCFLLHIPSNRCQSVFEDSTGLKEPGTQMMIDWGFPDSENFVFHLTRINAT